MMVPGGKRTEAHVFVFDAPPDSCLSEMQRWFVHNYDGTLSKYNDFCNMFYGGKRTCRKCSGAKWDKANGTCTARNAKSVKCSKAEMDYCEQIGCTVRNGKCTGKNKISEGEGR